MGISCLMGENICHKHLGAINKRYDDSNKSFSLIKIKSIPR